MNAKTKRSQVDARAAAVDDMICDLLVALERPRKRVTDRALIARRAASIVAYCDAHPRREGPPTPREAVAYWFKVRKWLDWDKPDYRADEHRAECHAQIRAWTAIARREEDAR